ncbi:hypothetical protein DP73_04685 [Desulfosporosinus sp. HMP52]|uniref:putative capsular polysaccharide synthesis family protein n=1 Tax=Desulfosporosinus sp. HMP52 TaxID=1487923 RepID=UPI00051FA637|nr:putative capsular polysaccharide synthesis family protein [Desulfosporosinus sp. HMP52]KGK91262.1 hypothetical protein DP73_04685 [Desulfosporosinus sp. HMP52]
MIISDYLTKKLIKDNIYIYQMGKVGSTTIETSLKAIGVDSVHKHTFYRLPHINEVFKNYNTTKLVIKKRNRNFLKTIKKIIYNHLVMKKFSSKNLNSKIISIVREPISRNSSMYFQDFYIPYFEYALLNKTRNNITASIDLFINDFFKRFNHEHGINWFDKEFLRATKINVYEYPFDADLGYCIINKNGLSILILQMEKMNALEKVIGEFVGAENFKLINDNNGTNKWYGPVYKDFKYKVCFSEEYIDSLYNSKYMKHFYSDKEIKQFRTKYLDWKNKQ